MSIEETKEAIRVMQAFVDGKKVEYQISDGTWLVGLTPSWNWPSTRYRIKHTPVRCDGGGEMISELNAANERIKRLEEAGDAMATYAHIIDFQNWKEAKEAKP
jgi:hypothetical protein